MQARAKYLLLATCLFLFPHLGLTQERLKIERLTGPISFDGIVEDEEWSSADTISLTQHRPIYGALPTERTDVFIGHDDKYFYLAGRMYHSDMSNLQATSLRRDAMEASSEYFGLLLDSFNDKENALAFFTTPVGLRFDASIFNDAQGGFPINTSWNTFWDVKTRKTDTGWEAEMRIPFSSLRFQETEGQVYMGMTIWRYMPGKNEIASFPAVANNLGQWSVWKPSRARDIYFEKLKPRKPVYIAPYVLGGYQTSNQLNDAETAYEHAEEPLTEVGLDVKYSLTTNLTMDVTINPDFAQVEADDQQVNLSRFNLFFPEKRLFFQERSSVFDFRFGGPDRLFYSRRIGLDEEVGQVKIYGGVRLVGRMGKWDMGFLDMQTEAVDTVPSTNYGVFRARRQVFNQFSYVGGMVANKLDVNRRTHTSVGLDGVFRISEDDYIELSMAQTYDSTTTAGAFSHENGRVRLSFQRRRIEGFRYHFVGHHSGAEFNPEMGFQRRENFYQFFGRVGWGWVPGENKWLLNHMVDLMSYNVWKYGTHDIESASLGMRYRWQSKTQHGGFVNVSRQQENLTEDFELGDVLITPGLYTFPVLRFGYNTPNTNLLSVESEFALGEFYDGNQVIARLSPNWKVSANLDLGIQYSYNRVKIPERNEEFIAHLARLRANYSFDTKLSLAAFVQHNSGSHFSFGNIRLRYNPREGNDLYIVWNAGINDDLYRETPIRPQWDSNTIVVKYTYTFVAGG